MDNSTARSGTTLLEVLIAIFVAGVGIICLLALFPLGAANMAQAIKDDRCATACANADALAHMAVFRDPSGALADLRHDATVLANFSGGPPSSLPALTNSFGPSYPVLVDPIGAYNYSGTPGGFEVGAQSSFLPGVPGVPRITATSFFTSSSVALQQCTLLDDMNFGVPSNGTPSVPPQRDLRYTWAYLLRKPYLTSAIADMAIVVFHGRMLQLGAEVLQPLDEMPYQAVYQTERSITLTWDPLTQQKPRVKKGTWVLDSTILPDPRGYFYRVVNVTDTADGQMDLEVQSNLKATGAGQAVVMESVAEVFERGTK